MKCKKQGQRALSWILVTAMMVPSVSVPTIAYAETNQRIATYVGQVPEQLKDDASVKADQFGKAYDTVAVTSKGVRYDVEVVPQELVYYIDNYSSGPLDGTTPAYEAVKELTGTKLKNDAADAVYVEGSWGVHNQNVKTKGTSFLPIRFPWMQERMKLHPRTTNCGRIREERLTSRHRSTMVPRSLWERPER